MSCNCSEVALVIQLAICVEIGWELMVFLAWYNLPSQSNKHDSIWWQDLAEGHSAHYRLRVTQTGAYECSCGSYPL